MTTNNQPSAYTAAAIAKRAQKRARAGGMTMEEAAAGWRKVAELWPDPKLTHHAHWTARWATLHLAGVERCTAFVDDDTATLVVELTWWARLFVKGRIRRRIEKRIDAVNFEPLGWKWRVVMDGEAK